MIHSYRLLVCCFCLMAWNAFGLDITGVVVDSATQETLDSAKLCLDLDPNECTSSDSLGRFHFVFGVGILTPPEAAGVLTPTVRYAHGNLDLYHFGTGAGCLKVFNMLGRCLYAKSFVSEKGKRITLRTHEEMRIQSGVFFIRIEVGGRVETGKMKMIGATTMLLPFPTLADRQSGSPQPMQKRTAIQALRITRAGYHTQIYTPAQEVETLVKIQLVRDNSADVEPSVFFSRLKVAVVPGGKETIAVRARDRSNAPETFLAANNNASVAAITITDSSITVTGSAYGKANITVTTKSGVSKVLPVEVYNPSVLDVGELLITYADTFQYRWHDAGSGGSLDGYYAHPIPPTGFHALGSKGWSGTYSPPATGVMVVQAKAGSGALAAPSGYTKVWGDHGSGASNDGSFWLPVAPAGYVAMGLVAQKGYNAPPTTDVMCVRADLVIAGAIGAPVWDDRSTDANTDFGSWEIDPPGTTTPHEGAYLKTGTFVGVASHTAPGTHPAMNVLRVTLPMLTDVPYQTYVPRLTGYDESPEWTVPIMAKEMLVPCTIIEDANLPSAWNVSKIRNTPFYRLERQVFYRRIYHNHNQTSATQTNSYSVTSGITTSESQRVWNETSISVTVEAGISIKAFSGSISTTVSTSFGYETASSVSELNETTISSSINTPPGKAAALWQKYNRFILKRHNGTTLEPVTSWEFGIESYVTDEYPDAP